MTVVLYALILLRPVDHGHSHTLLYWKSKSMCEVQAAHINTETHQLGGEQFKGKAWCVIGSTGPRTTT